VLHSRGRALVFGLPILLYLVYIVSIGGDFMNGRFLTPLLLYAVLTLADTPWAARPRLVAAVVVSALALALAMPESALRVWTSPPPLVKRYGVLNEQTSYYPFSGLIPMLRGSGPADHAWGRLGRGMSHFPHVTPHVSIGIFGYYAGPGVHVIDELGLGDPLLARLPATNHYAPGHFQRTVPAWYKDFLDRCVARVFPHGAVGVPNGTCLPYENELEGMPESTPEAETKVLYRQLLLVTQGPIWDRERLTTILLLNLTGSTLAVAR
jgi:arabinofuranosyltransferase